MSIYSSIRKASIKYSGLNVIPGASTTYKMFDNLIAPRTPQYFKDINACLYVDHNDQSIGLPLLLNGVHEPGLCSLIKRIVKPGMTCVDIGANIGYISILIGSRLKGYGSLVSFEPAKTNYTLLKKNINLNHLTNIVTIENQAVSDHNGTMFLRVSNNNSGAHSLVDTEINDSQESVNVVSLDSYFGDRAIDFIKIDVQGAEQLIIDGANKILSSRFRPTIVLEFWPAGLERANCDPAKLLGDLHDYGYATWMLDEDTGKIKSMSDNEIITLSRNMNHAIKGLGYCTLYCNTFD